MANEIAKSSLDIAVSGMQAFNQAMKVGSNNIANASTTRTENGGPYLRQMLSLTQAEGGLAGVDVGQTVDDTSTAPVPVFMKGHPDADANGYVMMPNVDLPTEMINMVWAARAYQANTTMLKKYQESVDIALELIR